MRKTTFTPEELVILAERAPRLLEIVDAVKLLAGLAVDFVCDRVLARLAEDRPVTYVYMGGFETDKPAYAGGERGTATWEGKLPVELLDIILVAPAAGFVISGLWNGDDSLLAGAGEVPADVWFPLVQSRWIRTHQLDPRRPIVIQFRNATSDPAPRALLAAGKFRSQFHPNAFANVGAAPIVDTRPTVDAERADPDARPDNDKE